MGGVDLSRTVTVEFTSTVMPGLPWKFQPTVRRLQVHPGEPATATYLATNLGGALRYGQAIMSVSPEQAAVNFKKIECFCFHAPSARAAPIAGHAGRVFCDRDLPKQITTITVSYSSISGRARSRVERGVTKVSANPAATTRRYFVPKPSPYPALLSFAIMLLAIGLALRVNGYPAGQWLALVGLGSIIFALVRWLGNVISESEGGFYHQWEDRSFRLGMIWFIISEITLFATLFGVLFYEREISVRALAALDAISRPGRISPVLGRHRARWARTSKPSIPGAFRRSTRCFC